MEILEKYVLKFDTHHEVVVGLSPNETMKDVGEWIRFGMVKIGRVVYPKMYVDDDTEQWTVSTINFGLVREIYRLDRVINQEHTISARDHSA